jgi:putative FmdB family regulatory protein
MKIFNGELLMPIYEYECASCHHHFDLIQKISDEPVSQCPQCLKDTAIKQISAAGFQLKGTGWYVTDFKNKKPAPSSESNKPAETKNTSEPTTTSPPVSETSSKGDSA